MVTWSRYGQPEGRVRRGQFQKEKFYSLPKTNRTINKEKINQWFQKYKLTLAKNKINAFGNFLAKIRHNLTSRKVSAVATHPSQTNNALSRPPD